GIKKIPWIGTKNSPELNELQERLQEGLLAQFNYPKETFTPHITLGRDVDLPNVLALPAMSTFDIEVKSLAFFESMNVQGNLRYIERAIVHLHSEV
ncbi:MAG: hypothetical protein H7X94_06650, partial [Vallitaleaceae bacterium]|nr:hypothetical protein [Vallitaleaceae bacterium]